MVFNQYGPSFFSVADNVYLYTFLSRCCFIVDILKLSLWFSIIVNVLEWYQNSMKYQHCPPKDKKTHILPHKSQLIVSKRFSFWKLILIIYFLKFKNWEPFHFMMLWNKLETSKLWPPFFVAAMPIHVQPEVSFASRHWLMSLGDFSFCHPIVWAFRTCFPWIYCRESKGFYKACDFQTHLNCDITISSLFRSCSGKHQLLQILRSYWLCGVYLLCQT